MTQSLFHSRCFTSTNSPQRVLQRSMQHSHHIATQGPDARGPSLRRVLVVRRGFGDDLLDYIQGMSSSPSPLLPYFCRALMDI